MAVDGINPFGREMDSRAETLVGEKKLFSM